VVHYNKLLVSFCLALAGIRCRFLLYLFLNVHKLRHDAIVGGLVRYCSNLCYVILLADRGARCRPLRRCCPSSAPPLGVSSSRACSGTPPLRRTRAAGPGRASTRCRPRRRSSPSLPSSRRSRYSTTDRNHRSAALPNAPTPGHCPRGCESALRAHQCYPHCPFPALSPLLP
jgi:hypothetical protein